MAVSQHGTLTAATVKTETVTVVHGFRIENLSATSTDKIDYRFAVNATPVDPVSDADDTYKLIAVPDLRNEEWLRENIPGAPKTGSFDVTVKMLSPTTPGYSIEAW